jgi:hypothetical protein
MGVLSRRRDYRRSQVGRDSRRMIRRREVFRGAAVATVAGGWL